MDEISKNIKKENIGIKIDESMSKIGCLQWVDDNLLAATNSQELQKCLDITDITSNEYHVEYGQPKSNTQIIKKRKKKVEKEEFKLGNMPLEMA